MRRNRKAKIIATLGPSTSNLKSIKKLYNNGADIFRLNFSHDVKESHIKRFKDIRDNLYPNSRCATRISGVKVNKEQNPNAFKNFIQ